jgi:hydroxymethylglutaryl-CoA lyase
MSDLSTHIQITETPRDGFQALPQFIPAERKIEYINHLLKCGFDTVEVGSFVSPRAIPQMADTGEVLNGLDLSQSNSKIAVLVVTTKGAQRACEFEVVDKLFYPFTLSATFLKKNVNQTPAEAEKIIDDVINLSIKYNKEPVIYYSWGFGDPYGDPWSIELLINSIEKMASKGLNYFPLSDIAGEVSPELINKVFTELINHFPAFDFGFHLHSLPADRIPKTEAAYNAGVRMFDSVIGGLGGCPMTGKELVANMDTGVLLDFFESRKINTGVNRKCVEETMIIQVI